MKYSDKVLILTPVKDAAKHLERYFTLLESLTYPHELISLGMLEGDSSDNTYELLCKRMSGLQGTYRRARVWKKEFGFQFPPGVHRWVEPLQIPRRTVLAKSRNHLLFSALDDDDWVLWLDVDVIEYPPDIIETLMATGRDIVHPHCVFDYGGHTFDQNAWCNHGKTYMDQMRDGPDFVRLDAVGGTMLMIRADIHRDGLIFPSFPYGRENPSIRDGTGELETEGLGLMARDMGHQCWGMPKLEIRHYKEGHDD